MTKLMLIVCFTIITTNVTAQVIKTDTPVRPKGQQDVLRLVCPPITVVRVAFIGLGMRGPEPPERPRPDSSPGRLQNQ